MISLSAAKVGEVVIGGTTQGKWEEESVGTRVVSASLLTPEATFSRTDEGASASVRGNENGTVGFVNGAKRRMRR